MIGKRSLPVRPRLPCLRSNVEQRFRMRRMRSYGSSVPVGRNCRFRIHCRREGNRSPPDGGLKFRPSLHSMAVNFDEGMNDMSGMTKGVWSELMTRDYEAARPILPMFWDGL